jgi:hypothetical protein
MVATNSNGGQTQKKPHGLEKWGLDLIAMDPCQ